MNVLSLFDGMSCGQIALNRAGINCDKYFASEIDKFAIRVSSENFPKTIHLGDVNNIDCKKLPKIDLLIGGSPCQGFSFSGKLLNFNDERSKLFFEYSRILKATNPKYFLLENVVMKKEYEQVITDHVSIDPFTINSSLFSAQSRKRLYWTNIKFDKEITDKNISLNDIIEKNPTNPTYLSDSTKKRFEGYGVPFIDGTQKKARCLSAMEYIKNGKQGNYVLENGRIRKLTIIECKRLQTIEDQYIMNVSNSQAYKMLGNGWTVDVIAHLLKGIK